MKAASDIGDVLALKRNAGYCSIQTGHSRPGRDFILAGKLGLLEELEREYPTGDLLVESRTKSMSYHVMYAASEAGHVHILQWCYSVLKVKPSFEMVLVAKMNDRKDAVDWLCFPGRTAHGGEAARAGAELNAKIKNTSQ